MAGGNVRGITLEIGADTKQLVDGLKQVDKELRETDRTLKDIEKGLKLDPKNAELLAQKMRYLGQAVEETDKKLEEEKKILQQLEQQDGGTGKYAKQIDAVKREIIETESKQEAYKKQLADTKKVAEGAADATEDYADAAGDAAEKQGKLGDSLSLSVLGANLMTEAIKLGAQALSEFVGFCKDSIKASAEYADNILTMASTTGLTTDQLQEMQYMAELVDVSVDTITGSMSKLTKNMASAKDGSGAMAKNFEALGVSVTDANGELRDNEDVFADVITALGNIENETERDAAAMAIFGKSAQDLNPLIEAGADTLEAFKQEAHDMGYVLDEETLGSLGEMDNAFQRLDKVVETAQNQIGAILAPVITDITNKFIEWAQSVDWEAVGAMVEQFINKVIEVVSWLAPIVSGVISTVIDIFTGMWNFLQDLWDFCVNVWDGIVQTITDAKDAMQPIIDGIVNFFQSVWDIVDKVVTKIGDFVGAISGAISKAGEFMSGGFGKVAGFFGSIGSGIGSLFSSGGFGGRSFDSYMTPSYASAGYSLSTNVTINNYSTPVTAAFADRVVDAVNEKLGRMLK